MKKYFLEVNTNETDFIEESDLHIWNLFKEACDLFSSFNLKNNDVNFLIKTDFSDFFEQFKINNYSSNSLISFTIEPLDTNFDKDLLARFSNSAAVNYSEILFLCFNLSLPGSFNLLGSKIYLNNRKLDEINLSCIHIESIWSIQKEFNWPLIQKIPLEKVITWYKSLMIDLKCVADNNIDRCIFSILHFCHYDSIQSPSNLIWLTHALESFYNIKSGEPILKTLKRRIKLHLGSPVKEKIINKKLNDFYNYRSLFVHGDLNILRLGAARFLYEDKADDYYKNLWNNFDFGMLLIISSLQKNISDSINTLSFEEIIKYS